MWSVASSRTIFSHTCHCPSALADFICVVMVVPRLTSLTRLTFWNPRCVVRVRAFTNFSSVFPVISGSKMSTPRASRLTCRFCPRIPARCWLTWLWLSHCCWVYWVSSLSLAFTEQILLMFLVRLLFLCMLAARVTYKIRQRGEILTTVIVVIFYLFWSFLPGYFYSFLFQLFLFCLLPHFRIRRVQSGSNCITKFSLLTSLGDWFCLNDGTCERHNLRSCL